MRLAVDKIKSVIQKILNRQKSFAKEAKDIESIADKLEAIQEQYDKLLMGNKESVVSQLTDSREQQKNASETGGVMLQIRSLPDGKMYVQADRQVIYGTDPSLWEEQITNYVNENIRKGKDVIIPTEDGDFISINGRTAWKLGYRNGENEGRPISEKLYKVKGTAAGHIDEIGQVSFLTGRDNDKDGKHGENASGGWDYRTAYFMDFDGKYYQLVISVMVDKEGKAFYNIGAIRERKPPKSLGSSVAISEADYNGARLGKPSDTTTLTQKSDDVNPYFMQESENDTQKNTSETGGVMYSPRAVGYENKIYDFDVSQNVINKYVEDSYQNKNEKGILPFLKVSNKLVSELEGEFNVSGFSHALRDNDIRHIRNSHGENTNEKYPVLMEDIELIPYIVENYDKVFYKTNANNLPGIVFVKVMPENVIYYVEAITEEYEGKKMLINKQMVKTGTEEIPNLKNLISSIEKKESKSQYLADLKRIRKAYVQDVTEIYSTDSIRNFSETVNTQYKGEMTQDRTPFVSAREILTQYAEESKNVKAKSKYLGEYVSRVALLDRKLGYLENAEADLALATDEGRTDDAASFTRKVKRLKKKALPQQCFFVCRMPKKGLICRCSVPKNRVRSDGIDSGRKTRKGWQTKCRKVHRIRYRSDNVRSGKSATTRSSPPRRGRQHPIFYGTERLPTPPQKTQAYVPTGRNSPLTFRSKASGKQARGRLDRDAVSEKGSSSDRFRRSVPTKEQVPSQIPSAVFFWGSSGKAKERSKKYPTRRTASPPSKTHPKSPLRPVERYARATLRVPIMQPRSYQSKMRS